MNRIWIWCSDVYLEASGITVDQKCIDEYNHLKMKDAYRYLTFHIADDKIRLLTIGARDKTFEDFKTELVQAQESLDCRYGVFDAEFKNVKDDRDQKKVIFVAWCPDTSPVKKKMVYSSSKVEIKKKLGLEKELQASDLDDLKWENVLDKLK